MASSLQLVEDTRRSADDGGAVRRSRRDYLDFVVDGESLGERLAQVLGDANLPAGYVPVLVLDWPIGFPAEDYGRLVGELPAAAGWSSAALYLRGVRGPRMRWGHGCDRAIRGHRGVA